MAERTARRAPRDPAPFASGGGRVSLPALGLVVLGLALAALGSARGSFLRPDNRVRPVRFPDIAFPTGGAEGGRRAGPFLRPGSVGGSGWTGVIDTALQGLLLVAFAVLVGAVIVVLVRGIASVSRLRLSRASDGRAVSTYDAGAVSEEDADEPLRRRLRRNVDLAATALEHRADPREVVIACYVGMERAAAGAGTTRRPEETPGELLARVLVEQRVPAGDAHCLTALFEEARFSARPVAEEMRTAARRSLSEIRAALGPAQ